jgi:hypothetical protein
MFNLPSSRYKLEWLVYITALLALMNGTGLLNIGWWAVFLPITLPMMLLTGLVGTVVALCAAVIVTLGGAFASIWFLYLLLEAIGEVLEVF